MFNHSPINLLKKNSKIIILSGILVALASMLVSLLFPLQYRADADVFIISKSRYGVDPYTVVKSAERVGENIAQVMKTDDFYQKVITQEGYILDLTDFEGEGVTERTKRKRWQKAIQSSVVFGTGVLHVSAYHEDPGQAKAFAGASVDTLVAKGWEYVGGDVTMKVVNKPVVTKFPARPNLLVNTVLGFIVGVLLMGVVALRRK
jgi:capsular polysaccharide biosynthesis protein